MFVRGVRWGFAMIGAVAAVQAAASPHPAGGTMAVASFVEVPKNGSAPKILYYKNADVVKTTTTSTKVQTGVDGSGKPVFKTVSTKSTAITPKAELLTTNGSSTAPAAATVKFLLSAPDSPYASILANPQDSLFSLSAVSTSAQELAGGVFAQLFSGTLSFTRTVPLYKLDSLGNATSGPLTNLLSITFTNAVLTGLANGSTIGFAASTPYSTIEFTSDFRTFTHDDWLSNFDFAIAGNAASVPLKQALVDPSLANVTGARSLNSFRVSTTGTFGASAVPEPASWAITLMGFAAIGVARRADVRKLARITA
jgi:hypothetical protein